MNFVALFFKIYLMFWLLYSKYVYGSIIPFANTIMLGYIQICLRTTFFCVFKVTTAVSNAEIINLLRLFSKGITVLGHAYFRDMLIFETVLITVYYSPSSYHIYSKRLLFREDFLLSIKLVKSRYHIPYKLEKYQPFDLYQLSNSTSPAKLSRTV